MSETVFLIVVQKVDLATECWIEQHQRLFSDLELAARLTGCDPIDLRAVYDLEAEDVARLCEHFGFRFDARPGRFEMIVFERNTPFPEYSHTGRELLLMLKGEKPLAVFSEPLATPGGESFIPEKLFAPFVASGQFVMKTESTAGGRLPVRRVLYALPDEAWRMEAYCMLWRLAEKQGWNPGFEAAEGYLLGYETAIDPFFRTE